MKKLVIILTLLIFSVISGCSRHDNDGDPPASTNQNPLSKLDVSSTQIRLGQAVSFSASRSTDPDGTIATYEWTEEASVLSSVLSTEENFSKDDFAVGNHTITLTVIDNEGAKASSSVTISVSATPPPVNGNELPLAIAQSSANVITTGQQITFTGEKSKDIDGSIVSYEWKEGDQLLSSDKNFSKNDFSTGSHTITLTVTDDKGATSSHSLTIVIIQSTSTNTPPVATAQSVVVSQDIAKVIILSGLDAENDTLSYSVITNPAHGSLSGTPPALTFTPANGYVGTDSFTFKVNDGSLDSASAKVLLEIKKDDSPLKVLSLRISSDRAIYGIDENINIAAQAFFEGGESKDVSSEVQWLIENPDIVTVQDNGNLLTRSIGATTVKAFYEDKISLSFVVIVATDTEDTDLSQSLLAFPPLPHDATEVRIEVIPFGHGAFKADSGAIDYDPDNNTVLENRTADNYPVTNDVLTLTATPKADSEIIDWLGCDTVSNDNVTCEVALDRDRKVIPIFSYKETMIVDNLISIDGAESIHHDWNADTPPTIESQIEINVGTQNNELKEKLESINVGDFIGSSNESGYLRKVVSVDGWNGSILTLTTIEAALQEVIIQGTIYFTSKLEEEQAVSKAVSSVIAQKKAIDIDVDFSKTFGDTRTFKRGGLSYGGGWEVTPLVHFGITISENKVTKSLAEMGVDGSADVFASGSVNKEGDEEWDIVDPGFRKITFPVGPSGVLIGVKPSLKLTAGISGSAEGFISITGAASGSFRFGTVIEDGEITLINEGEASFSKSATGKFEGAVKAYSNLDLDLELSGTHITIKKFAKIVGSIGASGNVFVEAEGKVSPCIAEASAYFGASSDILAKVFIDLSLLVVSKEVPIFTNTTPIFDHYVKIGSWAMEFPPSGFMPQPGSGPITVQLAWDSARVDLDLSVAVPGSLDVKDTGCPMENFVSDSLFDIYAGLYAVQESVKDIRKLEADANYGDIPFPQNIILTISTPGEGQVFSVSANSATEMQLGHVADINITQNEPEITPRGVAGGSFSFGAETRYVGSFPRPEPSPSGWSFSPSPTTVNDIEPKICQPAKSCGCLPCEFEIIPFLTQGMLGPISGASFEIFRAEGFGVEESVYKGETTIGNTPITAGVINIPDTIKDFYISDNEDYVITLSGGFDIDPDDDFRSDGTTKYVNGTLHAIVKGSDIKKDGFKVSILSEIAYQVSKDLLGNGYNQTDLEQKLQDVAQRVFTRKIYSDVNKPLGMDDFKSWMPYVDKGYLFKDYDTHIEPMVEQIYAGRDIYQDAYHFVYDPLSASPQAVIKSQIFTIDENSPAGTLVGILEKLSEGEDTILSYTLSGDGSEDFVLDNAGRISIKEGASINFERKQVYALTVIAETANGSGRPSSIYIQVNNISDSPTPLQFSGGVIAETVTAGMKVGQLTFDVGQSPITEMQISGAGSENFTVDVEGNIFVSDTASFDFETKTSYRIALRAINAFGSSALAYVTINISDEIDVPIMQRFSTTIDENLPAGSVVGTLDIQTGDNPVTAIIVEGEGKQNFIFENNGTILVSEDADLDYEKTGRYIFSVVVTNQLGDSRSNYIVIDLNDLDDAPKLERTRLSVIERAGGGVEVGQVTVLTEGDSTIHSFALTGSDANQFEIDSTGKITVASGATLDYNVKPLYSLLATASNASGTSRAVAIGIFINPSRPILANLTTGIDENTAPETPLRKMPVSFPGLSPITSYALSGDGSENFVINAEGLISVSDNANLDFETRTQYNLTVVATNTEGDSQPARLQILVADISDVPRIQGFTSYIYDSIEKGALLNLLSVLDEGSSPVTGFELTGEGKENFTLELDGSFRISQTALFNYEEKRDYILQAVAFNNAGKSLPVTINITLEQDRHADPQLLDARIQVAENIAVGTVIGKITSNSSDIKSITLSGDGADFFGVDATGVITLAQALDYETTSNYQLAAVASDNNINSNPSNVVITVTNVVESAPILDDISIEVNENTAIATLLDQVNINEASEQVVTGYQLSDSSQFGINPSGVVFVKATLDFETLDTHNLQVTATNSAGTSTPANVSITVLNDAADDELQLLDTSLIIDENLVVGSPVGTIKTSAENKGVITAFTLSGIGADRFTVDANGAITLAKQVDFESQALYSLSAIASNDTAQSAPVTASISINNITESVPVIAPFTGEINEASAIGSQIGTINEAVQGDGEIQSYSLSENSTFGVTSGGIVYLRKAVDFETKSRYELQLTASNSAGSSDPVAFVVTVLNSVDDDELILKDSLLSVAENAAVGSVIGSISISPNSKGTIKQITLQGTGADKFSADANGAITLLSALDFETKKSYSLNAIASNDSANSATVRVDITITNVLDTVPVLNNFTGSINEADAVGTVVGKVTEAPNSGGEVQSYTLSANTAFEIRNDGSLVLKTALDYETTPSYNLQVTAKNSVGESQPASVKINVINSIEDDEIVLVAQVDYIIREDAAMGSIIGKIAIHADSSGVIEKFTHRGEGSELFEINNNGDIKLIGALDYEEKSRYSLFVIASNDKVSSNEVGLRIDVDNVVDEVPKLLAFEASVRDDATTTESIGKVQVQDPGDSAISAFTLSGTGSVNFAISTDGTITLSASAWGSVAILDQYLLTVTASNDFGDSEAVDVVINVIKDTEAPVITVTGDNPVNHIQGETYTDAGATAEDDRDGTLTVSSEGEVDFNTVDIYTITYTATDTAGNTATATRTVNIITDRVTAFKTTLQDKCGIDNESFDTNFNLETGEYKGDITCANKDLTDSDLSNFVVLTSIEGDLSLNENQLSHVDGLSQLTSVSGIIDLDDNQLASIDGLSNLRSTLRLYLSNNQLSDLDGLSSLESIDVLYAWQNKLSNIDGLNNLKSIRALGLGDNQLTDINALSSLVSIEDYLDLSDNQLTHVDALTNTLMTNLRIIYLDNNQLINVDGLISLERIGYDNSEGRKFGGLNLSNNQLTNIDGLTNLKSVIGDLSINNNKLANVDGLNNLSRIKSYQYTQIVPNAPLGEIEYGTGGLNLENNLLANVDGLSSLHSVEGLINLQNNQLTNIDGLKNLRESLSNCYNSRIYRYCYGDGGINLQHNLLTNLDGLSSVNVISDGLLIHSNPELTDISGLQNIEYLFINAFIDTRFGTFTIDSDHEYTSKMSADSAFCRLLLSEAYSNYELVCDTEQLDSTPPVINIFGLETINITEGDVYNDQGATATDSRDGNVPVTTSGNVDSSKVGEYTITYTATDAAGNTATATRSVIVSLSPDTTAPVISLIGDEVINLTVGDSYIEQNATATDDLDGNVTITITGVVDTETEGTYTLTYSASDLAANTSSITRTVIVSLPPDITAPVVTINGAAIIRLETGENYIEQGATATDDRDGSVAVVITGSVDTNTADTYTISYTATDKAGNTSTKTRQVIVIADRVTAFKNTLLEKCSVSSAGFDRDFNIDTGAFDGSILCGRPPNDPTFPLPKLTDADLLNFSVLTSVGGDLYLQENLLTHVDGLSQLTSVSGTFWIHDNQLTNVDGLSNLQTVGEHFELYNNQLVNLDGLSALVSVGDDFSASRNQLTNIDGLRNLETVVSGLYLYDNQLTDINALSTLQSVGGVYLYDNQLTNVDGLINLRNVPEFVSLHNNLLNNLNGLVNLETVGTKGDFIGRIDSNGGLYLANNKLTNLDGLQNLKSVVGKLWASDNELTDIDGLNNLETIEGYLGPDGGVGGIYLDNNFLKNVDGLNKLRSVSGDLNLQNNLLENINGFSNLTKVSINCGNYFVCDGGINLENNQLTSLAGMINLEYINSSLSIKNNPQLLDISDLHNAYIYAGPGALGVLHIDTDHDYTTKVATDSAFCNHLRDHGYSDLSKVCQ